MCSHLKQAPDRRVKNSQHTGDRTSSLTWWPYSGQLYQGQIALRQGS